MDRALTEQRKEVDHGQKPKSWFGMNFHLSIRGGFGVSLTLVYQLTLDCSSNVAKTVMCRPTCTKHIEGGLTFLDKAQLVRQKAQEVDLIGCLIVWCS